MDVIQPNALVVLDYTLRGEKGEILDASHAEGGEPITYVHGYGMLVPGLERDLVGLRAGDTRDVSLAPEDAFGEHDEELVVELGRDELPNPAAVTIGDELVAESADGDEITLRVVELRSDGVLVDGNHPLAGMSLTYAVRVREVRAATPDEIEAAALAFEAAGYVDDEDDAEPGPHLVQLRNPNRA